MPKDAEISGLQNEVEILSASLEQSRLKLIELNSKAKGNTEAEFNEDMELANAKLINEIARKEKDSLETAQVMQKRVDELTADNASLKSSLANYTDYDRIKAQLAMLKVSKTIRDRMKSNNLLGWKIF